jgi:hypothetical protein
MTHEILQSTHDGIVHTRLSGVMTHADQQALEGLAKSLIDGGSKVRLLVTLEDFEGWSRDSAWGDDLGFQIDYGNEIVRVAVVGDQQWKDQALMFLGKGFRETEIEFFLPDSLARAKDWIRAA